MCVEECWQNSFSQFSFIKTTPNCEHYKSCATWLDLVLFILHRVGSSSAYSFVDKEMCQLWWIGTYFKISGKKRLISKVESVLRDFTRCHVNSCQIRGYEDDRSRNRNHGKWRNYRRLLTSSFPRLHRHLAHSIFRCSEWGLGSRDLYDECQPILKYPCGLSLISAPSGGEGRGYLSKPFIY